MNRQRFVILACHDQLGPIQFDLVEMLRHFGAKTHPP